MTYYNEVGFLIQSQKLWGAGEHYDSLNLGKDGNYTGWSSAYKGESIGPGDHPFVMAQLDSGKFIGLWYRNLNGKVIHVESASRGQSIINFKTTGGEIDFLFFVGETAQEVLRVYHSEIGKPALPPFWALGYHQGPANFENLEEVTANMEKYESIGAPLESVWFDQTFLKDF